MAKKEVKLQISYQQAGVRGAIRGELDLYDSENLPLALNFSIKSIDNISKSKGSFSKTFEVPATQNNNILLGHAHSDQIDEINDLIDGRIQCEVNVSGQRVFTGTLTVKTILKDNKAHSYRVTILGDNNNWVKQFKELPMCDADRDDFHSFYWSHGSWKWFNTNVPSPIPAHRSIVIPLITWGTHEYPYAPLNSYKAHIMEQTPAFAVRYLVYYYFEQAGYELVSDFFNTDFFMKLIMPLDPKYFVYPDDLAANFKYDARFRFDDGTGHSPTPNWQSTLEEEMHVNHCMIMSNRATNSNSDKGGLDRLAPFDYEVTDPANAGDLADHFPYPYGVNISPANSPFNLARGFRHPPNDNTAMWHWECPQTAQYRVRAFMSLIQGNYSQLRVKLTVCSPATTFYGAIPNIGTGASALDVGNQDAFAGGTQNILDEYIQDYSSYYGAKYREVDLDSGYVTINQGDILVVECYQSELAPNHNIQPSNGYILTKDFHQYDMQTTGTGYQADGFPGNGNVRDTRILIERFGELAYGDFIYTADYLPCNQTKLDFVSGLTGLFNLYWYTDEQLKKVYVEPYDQFYKKTSEAKNWTYKLDMSRKQEVSFLVDKLGKDLRFRYKEDNKDGEVGYLQDQQGYPYHSTLVQLQDDYLPEVEEHGTSFYAPTTSIRDREYIDGNNGDAPWVPLIVSEHVDNVSWNTKPEKNLGGFKLRILSYEGMKSFNGTMYASYLWNDNSYNGTNGETNLYPCAQTYHYSNDSFGETLDYADNIQAGLYSRFWAPYINQLADNPRVKECYMHLTSTDIAELDLRHPIYLVEDGHANGTYWIIEKIIDYMPHKDDVTKVRLLQIGANASTKNQNTAIVDENNSSTTVTDLITTNGGSTGTGTWGHGIGDGVVILADKDKDYSKGPDNQYNSNHSTIGVGNISVVLNGNYNHTPKNAGNILIGKHLKSMQGGTGQMILGSYNEDNPNAKVIIGGGDSESNRKNILTITNDGGIEFGDIGGGSNMVTTDSSGNYIDLYTESNEAEDDKTVSKIIKG